MEIMVCKVGHCIQIKLGIVSFLFVCFFSLNNNAIENFSFSNIYIFFLETSLGTYIIEELITEHLLQKIAQGTNREEL